METLNLSGQFLIATPGMQDPHFQHTVTLMCEHDDNGAFGIVLNRPSPITLEQILADTEIEYHSGSVSEGMICLGGPVHPGRGFVLHTGESRWESSMRIDDDLQLTTSKDILEAIAAGEGPQDYMIALGYSGWESGQLEREFAANAWLNCDRDKQLIFTEPNEQKWLDAGKLLGIDLSQLTYQAGHA